MTLVRPTEITTIIFVALKVHISSCNENCMTDFILSEDIGTIIDYNY